VKVILTKRRVTSLGGEGKIARAEDIQPQAIHVSKPPFATSLPIWFQVSGRLFFHLRRFNVKRCRGFPALNGPERSALASFFLIFTNIVFDI
jgi:hypothetical protein